MISSIIGIKFSACIEGCNASLYLRILSFSDIATDVVLFAVSNASIFKVLTMKVMNKIQNTFVDEIYRFTSMFTSFLFVLYKVLRLITISV
ncbi:hypothetical protein rpr22_CDSx550 [Rickettsia prowazekii str. Rp22]|uniref:Uncharacterized protein RP550 n=2 Tax=Rickettsia prowazekii TaxID=782 RepID=Y550_RICPR|nr:RecName: Full=Uncharacterized protein RP550 [Rickettsia prowazekii str. Madrid E]ADE30080.1 hypothetical protein rpr22_CDSx550 [Rickettsia prowazekii str. Rp22]CAA14999.1 unknown [Rickettsia prowazekii str. Madrid E]